MTYMTRLHNQLILLVGLLCSTQLLAKATPHQGSISGTVIDAATRAPLPGATITLQPSEQGAVSNELGAFQFHDLPAGRYLLQVSFTGYRSDSAWLEVRSNETTVHRMRLQSAAIELAEVPITGLATRPFAQLSAIDLQVRPVNSGQDLLRNVPGLFIAQHAGGGKAEQIFLRGFDIDHGTDVALSVDGMPVNMVSHAHGQGYSDLHFLIPETVERIEFEKGPYHGQVGNFATAGYVAFRTRDALDRSMVRLEGGSFDTWRGLLMLNLTPEQENEKMQSAYIASEYLFSNGWFESPQQLNRLNLFGKYQSMLGKKSLLRASGSHFRSRWDASGQIPVRAVNSGLISRFGAIDDTEGGFTTRTNANLSLTTWLPCGGTFENQLWYSHYEFDLWSNFTFFLEDSLNGDQIRQTERRDLYGYNGTYKLERSLLGIPARTEAGIQVRIDDVRDIGLAHTRNREEVLEDIRDGDIREFNAGVYVTQTLRPSSQWTVSGALRIDQFHFAYEDALSPGYDRLTLTQPIASPKLNIAWQPLEWLGFHGHAGAGFHSNDARVVLQQGVRQALPRGLGAEVGFSLKPLPRLFLSATAWRLNMAQEFVYVGDAGIVEPGAASQRIGVDMSVRYQLTDWLYADADLNLARPRFEGNAFVPLAPTMTSIGGLQLRLPSGISGSLRYRYLADRPANEDGSLTAEGFFLLDATVSWSSRVLEVGLIGQNLLDAVWKEAQFETESRLQGEAVPVSEIHFTPGAPIGLRSYVAFRF